MSPLSGEKSVKHNHGDDVPVNQAWSPLWRSPCRYLASWPSPPGCPWCEACRRPQPIWPGRTGGILALGAVLILILIVELIAWGL